MIEYFIFIFIFRSLKRIFFYVWAANNFHLLIQSRLSLNVLDSFSFLIHRTLQWVRSTSPIIIHINLDKVLKFLVKDTHYRNRFETGTSGGSTDKVARKSWEVSSVYIVVTNCENNQTDETEVHDQKRADQITSSLFMPQVTNFICTTFYHSLVKSLSSVLASQLI